MALREAKRTLPKSLPILRSRQDSAWKKSRLRTPVTLDSSSHLSAQSDDPADARRSQTQRRPRPQRQNALCPLAVFTVWDTKGPTEPRYLERMTTNA